MPALHNLHAFQDLNDSWSKIYSSIQATPSEATALESDSIPSATAAQSTGLPPTASQVVTFETIEEVLNNIETNPLVKSSLDQASLRYSFRISGSSLCTCVIAIASLRSARPWTLPRKCEAMQLRATAGYQAATFPIWPHPLPT